MDITGSSAVVLRDGTIDYPLSFRFSPCSAATANDGSLPFGATIISAEVQVVSSDGADITDDTAGVVSVDSGLMVQCPMSYPGEEAGSGRCRVFILLTLSSGAAISKRWDGLVVE